MCISYHIIYIRVQIVIPFFLGNGRDFIEPPPKRERQGKKQKQNDYRVLKGELTQSAQLQIPILPLCLTQLNTEIITFSATLLLETQILLKCLSFLALQMYQK